MKENKQNKKVSSKFGKNIVCDEEDNKNVALILPADENCENIKEIASKIGKVVVCDENA